MSDAFGPPGTRAPHLLVLGGPTEIVGRVLGLPVAVTLFSWPRMIDACLQAVAVRTLEVVPTDEKAVLKAARTIHAVHPFDAVLPVADGAVPVAAALAAELGIIGIAETAVKRTRDKFLLRETLAEAGLDDTEHRVVDTEEAAAAFLDEVAGPVIVKPADGVASLGVACVTEHAQLAEAVEAARGASASKRVLLERQLFGSEYSVETISARGVHRVMAITAKRTTGAPYFLETGHAVPAALEPADSKAIEELVLSTLSAVGMNDGACHTEVIAADGTAHVVEVNARLGGGRIWELVELATGVDLVAATVTALVTGVVPEPSAASRGAAVSFYSAPSEGVVDAVFGLSEVAAAEGVVRVGLLPSTPLAVKELVHHRARIGHVIAIGPDAGLAAERAARARDLIRLRMVGPVHTEIAGDSSCGCGAGTCEG